MSSSVVSCRAVRMMRGFCGPSGPPFGGAVQAARAALAEACRGERSGKRHPVRCQAGTRKALR